MSDDVRSRAEADLAGSVRWALDHCEAGVMPVGGVMSLRAALLAYNESRAALAAPVSPPAASRDAVAEVLLREASEDRFDGWTWEQLTTSTLAGAVVAVALARRQADAILSRWSAPPAPRGEAVAWAVVNRFDTYLNFDTDRGNVERFHERLSRHPADDAPYRVVALVPQESRSDDTEGRQAREEAP